MKMTTAIFDLDGTLLNTLGDLCDSVTYAVEKHGFPPVSMEQTRIRIGNGVRKLVERSIPEESRTDEMIDICLADFRAFCSCWTSWAAIRKRPSTSATARPICRPQ